MSTPVKWGQEYLPYGIVGWYEIKGILTPGHRCLTTLIPSPCPAQAQASACTHRAFSLAQATEYQGIQRAVIQRYSRNCQSRGKTRRPIGAKLIITKAANMPKGLLHVRHRFKCFAYINSVNPHLLLLITF